MHRQQGLVRGDNVLAVGNCSQHQFARQIRPANQLRDNLDVGVRHDHERVVGQLDLRTHHLARLVQVTRRRHAHHDFSPCSARNLVTITLQNRVRAAADDADTQQSDIHRLHRPFLTPCLPTTRRSTSSFHRCCTGSQRICDPQYTSSIEYGRYVTRHAARAGSFSTLLAVPSTSSLRNISLIPRTAWRILASFSIRANRTWSSP